MALGGLEVVLGPSLAVVGSLGAILDGLRLSSGGVERKCRFSSGFAAFWDPQDGKTQGGRVVLAAVLGATGGGYRGGEARSLVTSSLSLTAWCLPGKQGAGG